jgi:hypothetical protein
LCRLQIARMGFEQKLLQFCFLVLSIAMNRF